MGWKMRLVPHPQDPLDFSVVIECRVFQSSSRCFEFVFLFANPCYYSLVQSLSSQFNHFTVHVFLWFIVETGTRWWPSLSEAGYVSLSFSALDMVCNVNMNPDLLSLEMSELLKIVFVISKGLYWRTPNSASHTSAQFRSIPRPSFICIRAGVRSPPYFWRENQSSFPVSDILRLFLQSNMADQQTSQSNSTGTSSSSQSQSVPSSASMDSSGTAATLPTQDVVDGMSDEEEQKISSWGRLFPLGTGFQKVGKCYFSKTYLNTVRGIMGRTY